MTLELAGLLAEFAVAADVCEIPGWPCNVRTELMPAPHRLPPLPAGFGGVYVFALSNAAGARAPAGPSAVL